MNTLKNEVHITAQVATTPEKKSEKAPYKFRIGHGGGGRRKDGSPWPTQWFSVTCWDAKIMEGIAKGDRVEISGKLRDSTFTAKDGTVKYGVEIVAETIVVDGAETTPDTTKNRADLAHAILRPATVATPNVHGVEITDDDIPF